MTSVNTQSVRFLFTPILVFVWLATAAASLALGQARIIDGAAYDQVTLDEENGNKVLRVFPLKPAQLRRPEDPKPSDLLVFRLLDDPTENYEISWRNIKGITRFHQLVLDEANQLIAQGASDASKLDQAFEYLDFLRVKYPQTVNLQQSMQRLLFADAGRLYAQKNFEQALAVIEELYRSKPDYQQGASSVEKALNAIADGLLEHYIEDNDKYDVGRALLTRLEKQYRAPMRSVTRKWRQAIRTIAAIKRDQAQQHLDAGEFHAAHFAAQEMMEIDPQVEGAQELLAKVEQAYSMFAVGVMQAAEDAGQPRSLANWASRRVGKLTRRAMFEFAGFGAEGGKYEFAHGDFRIEENSRRLTLLIDKKPQGSAQNSTSSVTGYDVSRRLLELANPHSEFYQASWARLLGTAQVEEIYRVVLDLRVPFVAPEAHLQVPLFPLQKQKDGLPISNGPYEIAERSDEFVRLTTNPRFSQNGAGLGRADIIETHFSRAAEAIAALEQGEVDIVDQLFPADAARLLESPGDLKVVPYGVPSIHLLIPKFSDPYAGNRNFRRAILYAINRQKLLDEILLGKKTEKKYRKLPGCRVVSGPFPYGVSGNEIYAYAYNESIEPWPYDPYLAMTLLGVAQSELNGAAEKRGEEPPSLGQLVIGHPPTEAAKRVCGGLVQLLSVINLNARLKPLPPGAVLDPQDECHFTYAEIMMTEPLVDARRLMGVGGLAPVDSAYIRQLLQMVDASTTWRQARLQLRELHQITHFELSVLPLFQIADYFAHRRDLSGFGDRPIWLYQNFPEWRNVQVAGTQR